jgi:hypothetical protein
MILRGRRGKNPKGIHCGKSRLSAGCLELQFQQPRKHFRPRRKLWSCRLFNPLNPSCLDYQPNGGPVDKP